MSLHHLMYLDLILCLLYRVIVLAAGSIQLYTVSSTFLDTKPVYLDLSFGGVLIENALPFLATQTLQMQGLTRELYEVPPFHLLAVQLSDINHQLQPQ